VKAGYDVTLIVQHEKNETVDRVKIIALSEPKNRLQRIFFMVFKVMILAIKQKADVYHFHDPELLYAGALLKLLTGKKLYMIFMKMLQNKYYIKIIYINSSDQLYHFVIVYMKNLLFHILII